MEDLYSIHPGISRGGGGGGGGAASEASGVAGGGSSPPHPPPPATTAAAADLTELMKAQIAGHPSYPSLLSAYIECRKETYCRVLERYKEELTRPFDEAASFLTGIHTQLASLCGGAPPPTDNSEDEPCSGDADAADFGQEHSSRLADHELKEMLLKKYSGCLSRLRSEFLKKRKKGKLPKDARSALMDWWNTHYRWPYPTEEDKVRLAAMTGLDPKQINNWFINQRKRHWKPSEDMRFALMEGVTGGSSSGTTLYFDTGTIGP
ncbi:hypothetical protein OsJ_16995 [Oryza sativa Japonica Group]|uniref:Uncharacterized protein n=1 Tax=Oryza sativa subsp. japonica TaxID=39947 RepID=B9FM99_ORYSJ|nr:hypothetical protein OsJ_16995 [Oryza sativa Japonica Group]